MNTTAVGRNAESAVVFYLEKLGHKIVAQNYRTRFYEIDIITEKDSKLFFTEVKYRSYSAFGNGLAYITPKKLGQMRFATETFLTDKKLNDRPVALAVASVSGENLTVDDWFELTE